MPTKTSTLLVIFALALGLMVSTFIIPIAAQSLSDVNVKTVICRENELSIDEVSKEWYYANKPTPMTIIGCFPTTNIDAYNLRIGQTEATVTGATPTTLTFLAPKISGTSHLNMDLTLTVHGDIGPSTVTLHNFMSAYNPIFYYISPYAVPLVPGQSEMRVSISGFPPLRERIDVFFDDIKIDIIERQNHYMLLRLPETFPTDQSASKFYTINFDTERALQVDVGVSIYDPANNYDRYITKLTPSWLPLAGEIATHDITIHGAGLSGATQFGFYHPWTQERLDSGIPKPGATNTSITFGLDSFTWLNTTLWPKFNKTRYFDLLVDNIYQGPIRFEVLQADGGFIASGEITFVKTPAPKFLVPTGQVPVNYVASTNNAPQDKSNYISISAHTYDFPIDVPVRIGYGDKWVLHRQRQTDDDETIIEVGKFFANSRSFTFPVPPCSTCTIPFKSQLCLLSEDDKCIATLGELEYVAAIAPKKPTITKTWPPTEFFENFSTSVDSYFYNFPTQDLDITHRLFYRHDKSGQLLSFDWTKTSEHSFRAQLPRKCGRPGSCPEGKYTPVLYDNPEQTKLTEIYVEKLAPITLTFNREDAYEIVISTSFPYATEEQRTIAMDSVLSGIKANYFDQENILPVIVVAPNRTETSSFNFLTQAIRSIITDDDPEPTQGAQIHLIIRPNSTFAQMTADDFTQLLGVDIRDQESGLRYQVPEILGEPLIKTKLNYCPAKTAYISGECPETDKEKGPLPKWVIYGGITVICVLFILLVWFLLVRSTSALNKRRKTNDHDENLLSSENIN